MLEEGACMVEVGACSRWALTHKSICLGWVLVQGGCLLGVGACLLKVGACLGRDLLEDMLYLEQAQSLSLMIYM